MDITKSYNIELLHEIELMVLELNGSYEVVNDGDFYSLIIDLPEEDSEYFPIFDCTPSPELEKAKQDLLTYINK